MRYLKVRELSISRIEEILASINTNVKVQILPNHRGTYLYVGVSIYKVNVLGQCIEDLLNRLEVPFKYFDKFID